MGHLETRERTLLNKIRGHIGGRMNKGNRGRHGGAFKRNRDQSLGKEAQNRNEWATIVRQALAL